ncbi:protein GRIM REAPER [Henckelia pumila]|uniref:protein GRIM REAPER n=1 Tax=Henckelia pumila TaxID=405737 RepID=UPI003C6DE84F
MAKTTRSKPLVVILSLFIFLILNLHFQNASSLEDEENDDVEEYVLDSPLGGNRLSTRSRFLVATSNKVLKKGASCDAKNNPNVCNGVSANKGTGLLYCCKKHCRDVLSDWNNCGACGRRCQQWERCCGGVCTNVRTSTDNCGKCNRKCGGVTCDFGVCGYA